MIHVRRHMRSVRTAMIRIACNLTRRRIVHFLHIGKTGGTAVQHALRGHWRSCRYVVLFHPHTVTLRDIPVGERVIFFLRQPVGRFVSGFYSRQREGRPRRHAPWSATECLAFADFHTANELACALSAVDASVRGKAERAMAAIGHVRTRYADWFESTEYLLSRRDDIFCFGFQETLATDFCEMRRRLGLPERFTLPADAWSAHRRPTDRDSGLEECAHVNLAAWYIDDIRFYEFCERLKAEI